MARKSAKPAFTFPQVDEIWLFSNGERRKVIAVNGPFIEWQYISGLTCGRFAPEGICDLLSWYTGKPHALRISE